MIEFLLFVVAYLAAGYGLVVLSAWYDASRDHDLSEAYTAGLMALLIAAWPLMALLLAGIMVADYIENHNLKIPRAKLDAVNPAKVGESIAKRNEKHILVHGNGEEDG